MVKKFKAFLAGKIFRSEFTANINEIKGLEGSLKYQQQLFYAEVAKFNEKKASYSIVDMVREQMKGFNPRLLDQAIVTQAGDTISDPITDALFLEYSEEDFLAECKTLAKNWALPIIFESIKRNQIMYAAIVGSSLNEINFARATINGLALGREEITRLEKVYDERHKAPDKDFDKHGVV
jgi:hypothetical protein